MKIGWRLLLADSSFWVQVLASKYQVDLSSVLQNLPTKYGFLYGKDHVKSAICWSVGSGATVRFWWDNWGVEDKPLILNASSRAPMEIIINKVLDFVTQDGNWKCVMRRMRNQAHQIIIEK